MTLHSSWVKSSRVTDKHNTKYNIHSLVNSQYIHARWLIFTFPGQNEPRPGHGTPWVNSGTIPAIPGWLASLDGLLKLGLYGSGTQVDSGMWDFSKAFDVMPHEKLFLEKLVMWHDPTYRKVFYKLDQYGILVLVSRCLKTPWCWSWSWALWSWSLDLQSCCQSRNHVLNQLFVMFHVFYRI